MATKKEPTIIKQSPELLYHVQNINNVSHEQLDELKTNGSKLEVIQNSLLWLGFGIIVNLVLQSVYLFELAGKH